MKKLIKIIGVSCMLALFTVMGYGCPGGEKAIPVEEGTVTTETAEEAKAPEQVKEAEEAKVPEQVKEAEEAKE